jgi:hypothetical protein
MIVYLLFSYSMYLQNKYLTLHEELDTDSQDKDLNISHYNYIQLCIDSKTTMRLKPLH